jgi:hypothetical protein
MSDSLFREGGPYKIRRRGRDEYGMRLSIPLDSEGMMGRECPSPQCVPAYFKVKPGIGKTEEQEFAYCPYCRTSADPGEFLTKAQENYVANVVENEVMQGLDRMAKKALGIGPSGKRTIGGGPVSMEISYKSGAKRIVSRPVELELRRDLECPSCGLAHAVFGLAVWCPNCGNDIFLIHLEQEFSVVLRMLSVVDDRRKSLGVRVAARDVENALEDVVSIFEAVLKVMTRRKLNEAGRSSEDINHVMERVVRNRYQNPSLAGDTFRDAVGAELFEGIDPHEIELLQGTFEKRHPITHNLGVVDRKYLERVQAGSLEGRDVRVGVAEIEQAIKVVSTVIEASYLSLFPNAIAPFKGGA